MLLSAAGMKIKRAEDKRERLKENWRFIINLWTKAVDRARPCAQT